MMSGMIVHNNNIGADEPYVATELAIRCPSCGRTELGMVYDSKAETVQWRAKEL